MSTLVLSDRCRPGKRTRVSLRRPGPTRSRAPPRPPRPHRRRRRPATGSSSFGHRGRIMTGRETSASEINERPSPLSRARPGPVAIPISRPPPAGRRSPGPPRTWRDAGRGATGQSAGRGAGATDSIKTDVGGNSLGSFRVYNSILRTTLFRTGTFDSPNGLRVGLGLRFEHSRNRNSVWFGSNSPSSLHLSLTTMFVGCFGFFFSFLRSRDATSFWYLFNDPNGWKSNSDFSLNQVEIETILHQQILFDSSQLHHSQFLHFANHHVCWLFGFFLLVD